MKKLSILSASAVALLAFAASAQAQTVSVQFPGYYSGPGGNLNGNKYQGNTPGTTAGVVSVANWNDALPNNTANSFQNGNGLVTGDVTNDNLITWVTNTTPASYPNNGPYTTNPGSLVTSTGASSSLLFDLSGANLERSGQGNMFTNGTGDYDLAAGNIFNDSSSAGITLSLANLNSGDNYRLLAYVGTDYYFYTSGATISASLGSTTYYLDKTNAQSSWVQATSTNSSSPTLANYVEFDGSGATLEADTLSIAGAGAGLSGFQLIDMGAPEPSAIMLMGVGLVGLVFFIRRKSMARI